MVKVVEKGAGTRPCVSIYSSDVAKVTGKRRRFCSPYDESSPRGQNKLLPVKSAGRQLAAQVGHIPAKEPGFAARVVE
jgi:hypothetical protein